MRSNVPDDESRDELTPEYRKCLSLLRETIPPPYPDPATDPQELDRVMRRIEDARREHAANPDRLNRLIQRVESQAEAAASRPVAVKYEPSPWLRSSQYLALAASVAALVVAVVSLYRPPTDGRKPDLVYSDGHNDPIPAGLMPRSDSEAQALDQAYTALEIGLLRQDLAQLAKLTRPSDRDLVPYVDATLARDGYFAERIQNLAVSAGRRGTRSTAGVLKYDDAAIRLAALLSSRWRAAGPGPERPVVVVNGAEVTQVESHAYTQDAIDWISKTLPVRDGSVLDEGARGELLSLVTDHAGRSWPEELRSRLAAAAGSNVPPVVIVVNARVDTSDRTRGEIQAVTLDPTPQGGRRVVEVEKFEQPRPPVDLFESFHVLDKSDGVQVSPSLNPNEIRLTFSGGDQSYPRVSLGRDDRGLSIPDHFPSRLAEVVLEAKAAFVGEGEMPAVEFSTGGAEVFLTRTPPFVLGAGWQRVTIPIELTHGERLKTGLSLISRAIPEGGKLTVSIRNALIRPLGDALRPAR